MRYCPSNNSKIWLAIKYFSVSCFPSLSCSFTSKKSVSFHTLAIRYYTLKNPATEWNKSIWLIIQKIDLFQIWDLSWNINSNMDFHSRLIPEISHDKNFQKLQKHHIVTKFGSAFAQDLREFSRKLNSS